MAATSYPNAPDVSPQDYIVVGISTCFVRDDGEVHPVQVAEPIPSAALEALLKGIPTSYEIAYATTLDHVLDSAGQAISSDLLAQAQLCDDFADRTLAAARTYKARPSATQHIPVGTHYDRFQHSTERKRVLNSERIVKVEDNVKQHAYTHQTL